MRQILGLILIATYILGLSFSDPSHALAPSVKIKLEHTHEVTVGHTHHHDLAGDSGHEDGYDTEHQADHEKNIEHKHSVPHSHEISVSMSNGYVLGSSSLTLVSVNIKANETILTAYSDHPPKDISLSSIFRPPIA